MENLQPGQMKQIVINFLNSLKRSVLRSGFAMAGLLLILISGCTRYQYIAITGDTPQNKQQNFVVENDTARIVYSFRGMNFPVTVEVYNKLNIPLYVDWSKSALIVGGKSMSFWQDVANLNGSTQGYSVEIQNGISYNVGSVSGTIVKNDKVSFVAPGSYIRTTRFHLQSRFFNTASHETVKKEQFNSANGAEYGKLFSFSKDHSPLEFRSYLTLSTDKNFASEIHFRNSFWVSGITQTMARPSTLENGDFSNSYIQKITGVGAVLGWILGIGVLGGLAVLAK